MVVTSPFIERIVLAPQTSYNVIPNSAGVWTNTSAKLLRAPGGCKIKADPTLIVNPVKTGTRGMQPGIPGRRTNNTWSLPNVPIIPCGTTLTAPDMDLLLQSIFGQTPTSGAYTLSDGIVPFIVARFQHLQTGLTQQFAPGAITTDWSIEINGDIFTISANGECFWVLDSENFANEDTTGLCGLTAFPLELSSPTVLGTIQQGFIGTATFDGNGVAPATFPLIKAGIKGKTGNAYTKDPFGTSYPGPPAGGRRSVTTAVTFQDCDSAFLNNLKVKAKTKTPINITYVVGNTAGNIVTIPLKGVQLAVPEYSDEAARVVTAFADSEASASTISALDELAMSFT